MKNDENKVDLDYKNLYFELKEKYDKLKIEIEELRLQNKSKENELNKLRKNSKENFIRLNLNSLDKKDFLSDFNNIGDNNNNNIYKHNSKKYGKYSIDSFRNDIEQGNDILNDLIKTDIDEIKLNNFKIEDNECFQIISIQKNNFNNININSFLNDIDTILLNIKRKQESLYQTKKMLNLKNFNI